MSAFARQFFTVSGVHVRDFLARSGGALVAMAGVAGTTFILVSVLAIAEGVEEAARGAGVDNVAIVVTRDAAIETSSSLSREDVVAATNLLGGLTKSAPLLSAERVGTMDTVSHAGEAGSQVIARALGAAGVQMRPGFRIVEGRAFRPGALEVIVGRRLARDVAGLRIGETVTGSAQEWRVVGVFEEGGSFSESEVWMDLDAARMESGRQGSVSSLRARFSSGEDLPRLQAAIGKNTSFQLVAEREYRNSQSAVLIARVKMLAVGLALMLAVGAIVAMVNAMTSAIAARQRSFSTMRALGFDGAPIAAAVFLEAVMLGLVGSVIGGAAAYFLANGWGLSLLNAATSTPISLDAKVTWTSLSLGALAGITVGALASLVPSIAVARADVLAALRSR